MNVLVLGGNGFIGSHIVDQLLQAGHSVRVYDRSPEKFRDPLPDVDYRLGDFGDTFFVAEALEGIDVVYHLISTTTPATSNLDPVTDINSNLIGTISLLNNMCEAEVKKIIFLSSGGTVYGNPERIPIDENEQLKPICSYGVVKVAIEKYLHMYEQLYGLKHVIIRAANPYGPRQGHGGVQGLIGTLLKKAIHDKELSIWGDGSIIRDYIYITDLAKLCICAIEESSAGIFNAGSGEGKSVNDILALINTILGKDARVRYISGRAFDVRQIALDIGRASQQFDWQPKIDLKSGISLYYEWMRKQ